MADGGHVLPELTRTRRDRSRQLRAGLRVLHEEERPRLCSDIPCLALGVAGAGSVCVLCGLAAAVREPVWLQAGLDYNARACGVHPHFLLRPWVYYPLPDNLALGRCVDRCPDFEDFASVGDISVPRVEPLMLEKTGANAKTEFSQAARLVTIPVYPSSPAVGRYCVPAPDTVLSLAPPGTLHRQESVFRAPTGGAPMAKDSMLPELHNTLGARNPQLRRTLGGLMRQWRWIAVCATLVPLLAAGLPCVASRHCPQATAWGLALGVGVLSLGLGVRLILFCFLREKDFILSALNTLQLSLAWGVGWALVVAGATVLCAALALRSQIRWAASCVGAAMQLLSEEGLAAPLGTVALLIAVAQAAASMGWLLLLEAFVSSAEVAWPAELPTVQEAGDAATDSVAELVPGGPIVRSLHRSPVFNHGPLLVLAATALVLRLVLAFLASLGRALATHIVTAWYFTEPARAARGQRLGPWPVLSAFGAVGCAHMGGVVSSTLLHALLPSEVILPLAVLLHKSLAPWHGPEGWGWGPCGICVCCPQRAGLSAGRVSAVLSAGPASLVALDAGHFHVAALNAASALTKSMPAHQFLFGLPTLLEALGAALASLSAFALLLLVVSGQRHGEGGYVETEVALALAGAALAYAPACTWTLRWTAGLDALLCCMIRDDNYHRGLEEVKRMDQDKSRRWALSVDTSHALWTSEHTPGRLRSLVFEAAQTVQEDMARRAGRSAHSFNDGVRKGGYVPIDGGSPGDSGSGSGPDN